MTSPSDETSIQTPLTDDAARALVYGACPSSTLHFWQRGRLVSLLLAVDRASREQAEGEAERAEVAALNRAVQAEMRVGALQSERDEARAKIATLERALRELLAHCDASPEGETVFERAVVAARAALSSPSSVAAEETPHDATLPHAFIQGVCDPTCWNEDDMLPEPAPPAAEEG